MRITNEALHYTGSAVGLLPRGKWIGVNTMLYGLMLPSGNDAAIALAQRAAGGSEKRFVRYMNEKAEQLGLVCTHFSTPSGFEDKDNHSCAARPRGDRARRAARAAAGADRRQARGDRCRSRSRAAGCTSTTTTRCCAQGYPGTTGIKTGYTDAAGRCLVATARRGPVKLGVVLLDSPDPGKQAMQLLDRGFRASASHRERVRRAG